MADFKLDLLQHAQIASPCPKRWEDMKGDDKIRHCDDCDLHVHNLSAMTEQEARSLLGRYFTPEGERRAERFCATIYRRADGTILTNDCPVGLAAIRAKARRALARCVAGMGGLVACAVSLASLPSLSWSRERLRECQPFEKVATWIDPNYNNKIQMRMSGDMCIAPPTPPPQNAAPTKAP